MDFSNLQFTLPTNTDICPSLLCLLVADTLQTSATASTSPSVSSTQETTSRSTIKTTKLVSFFVVTKKPTTTVQSISPTTHSSSNHPTSPTSTTVPSTATSQFYCLLDTVAVLTNASEIFRSTKSAVSCAILCLQRNCYRFISDTNGCTLLFTGGESSLSEREVRYSTFTKC